MKYLKYIIGLALFLLVLFVGFGFSVMNSDPVAIQLLPSYAIEGISVAGALLSSFLLGLLFGVVILSFSLIGQKVKTGSAKRKLKKVEKEMESLKAAEPSESSQSNLITSA